MEDMYWIAHRFCLHAFHCRINPIVLIASSLLLNQIIAIIFQSYFSQMDVILSHNHEKGIILKIV